MRRYFLLIVFIISNLTLLATHQRSGEITYEHLSGLTYRFTIVTYTYTPSPADRPEIEVFWGDGSSSIIQRYAKVNMENDISKNVYVETHTYAGNGTYSVSFEDPNRNAGIVNIPNSVSIPFYIETTLIINPFLGANSSPQLLNPPIDNGCLQTPYCHNPGAFDADGDSLSFSLITCRGVNGEDIPGYTLPHATNAISIDPETGDLVWDSPTMVGEYNIAILIQEWRQGVLIGNMVRDMQITIAACQNQPPVITAHDTCITAGELLVMPITATDPDGGSLSLTATGSCLLLPTDHANFSNYYDVPSPITSNFIWQTQCSNIKANDYKVYFKAQDNGPQVALSTFKTISIRIVAPAPEDLESESVGNIIKLSWSPYSCTNGRGFYIYRRNGSNHFEPAECEVGMPDNAGYHLIGTVNDIHDTSFTDDGSTVPLLHGNEYCYRIVAFFADGAQSYVSNETCSHLINDAPLLTHIDVTETDALNGEIFISWLKPNEFDSLQFPSPDYQYRIFRKSSDETSFTVIDTTFSINDTAIYDNQINTLELNYQYKVEFWGERNDSLQFIETSDNSSSIYLNINSFDKKLRLNWEENVSWQNLNYTIFKLNDDHHSWDSIAETSQHFYFDENLENEKEYCYFVRSEGGYFAPDTLYPLFNRSQKNCGIPIDNVPPEIPEIEITTDCESIFFDIHFSSAEAAAEVKTFFIYYKQTLEENFSIIDSFGGSHCQSEHCRYELTTMPFVTGCFALASIDSNSNLSGMTEQQCFDADECFDYRLPNAFTPNGDGVNDLFQPFQPYHNVEKIDMTIYNRWGRKVFETHEPKINWDGRDYLTKEPSSDGTYFYSCDVYLHSLQGLVVRPLHGTITLVRER
ncbi:MAG: gliding motility-associated C-terminal domain-containing protein [Bacteroidales bacterium]|nr:gliding motility-associated C-terminal domain-containing protein [Bacteroidales bacterium]